MRAPSRRRAAPEGCSRSPPKASTVSSPAKRWAWKPSCRQIRTPPTIRPSPNCPTFSARSELVKIGEPALAEEMLRHQAKIGNPAEHHALIQLAKQLDLPAAQLWLANNGQPGRSLRRRRPLSQPALEPRQRLAGRSRARLRPHRPGIGLPPHCRQHGWRGRPDAGPSGNCAARLSEPQRALLQRCAYRSALSISNSDRASSR